MSVSFLPAINVQTFSDEERGLSLRQLSYFTNVYVELNPDNIDDAPAYLRETIGLYETHFDVTAVESLEDIISLLDSGAAKTFVTLRQLEQLVAAGVDESRLIRSVDGKNANSFGNTCANAEHAILLRGVADAEALESAIKKAKADPLHHKHGLKYVRLAKPTEHDALRLAKVGAIPIVPATKLTVDKKTHPDAICAPEIFMANAQSDRPDGLLATIVTDERGISLGLVYSSKESVIESLRSGRGVYQSRKRGLWKKGETSGDIQELISMRFDCDYDTLNFMVKQKGRGFCHLPETTCFGPYHGIARLQQTLKQRKKSAPEGSYTARLFNDMNLLNAKIMEEASELCEARNKEDVSWECADLIFFALTKCIAAGVSLDDVELNLDVKSVKVKRRKGDAKPPFVSQMNNPLFQASQAASTIDSTRANAALAARSDSVQANGVPAAAHENPQKSSSAANSKLEEGDSRPNSTPNSVPTTGPNTRPSSSSGRIQMTRYDTKTCTPETITNILQRPSQKSTNSIMNVVKPIIDDVRKRGDQALLEYTHKFEKADLKAPVLNAPFPENLMQIPDDTVKAIDTAFKNITTFHTAQKESKPLVVETMPGVTCSRFSRPIDRVGLYVPGGSAVLPSTALMLGVPAMVAGCKTIVLATPPRSDGSITPEIVYIAHKIGASSVVLAGGAQAVAALAYGTQSVAKVDKILGPGNQFVTAAKMHVSNDTSANVAIDMPAGPSEVLVIADEEANPAFVAADLLSQAEHGPDSQVVLIAVGLSEQKLQEVEREVHEQAMALPRVDIVRTAISHSVTLCVSTIEEALELSNQYAPEHLILQTADPAEVSKLVTNAGSVFIGPYTPESVGDYSAGVNHSLPTYGYARMYSGVNLGSYVKHITSSQCTEEGLRGLSQSVMTLAKVEGLEAHRRAVEVRLK